LISDVDGSHRPPESGSGKLEFTPFREELRQLAKQKLSKRRNRRSVARVFKSSKDLIDIESTFLRANIRLEIVIDILWDNKTEATASVFELAFREVMAEDIRLGRDRMNLLDRIQSRE
jgi:hypothetical protein